MIIVENVGFRMGYGYLTYTLNLISLIHLLTSVLSGREFVIFLFYISIKLYTNVLKNNFTSKYFLLHNMNLNTDLKPIAYGSYYNII